MNNKITGAIAVFLLVTFFSFFTIGCDKQQGIEGNAITTPVQREPTGTNYESNREVYMQEYTIAYEGDFNSKLARTDKLRIYFDYFNYTGLNTSDITISLMGVNSTGDVVKESFHPKGVLNGTGCNNATGLPPEGCANVTSQAYSQLIGFYVHVGNKNSTYYQGNSINMMIDYNTSTTNLFTIALNDGNQTQLATRTFNGRLVDSLLFNNTVYGALGFRPHDLRATKEIALLTNLTCYDSVAAVDQGIYVKYEVSPDGMSYIPGGLGDHNLTLNATNWTQLSEYEPTATFKFTQVNTTGSGESCTLLLKMIGYNN